GALAPATTHRPSPLTHSRAVAAEREPRGRTVPQAPSALLRADAFHPVLASNANLRQFRQISRTKACERSSSRRIVEIPRREPHLAEQCGGPWRAAQQAPLATHQPAFSCPR